MNSAMTKTQVIMMDVIVDVNLSKDGTVQLQMDTLNALLYVEMESKYKLKSVMMITLRIVMDVHQFVN